MAASSEMSSGFSVDTFYDASAEDIKYAYPGSDESLLGLGLPCATGLDGKEEATAGCNVTSNLSTFTMTSAQLNHDHKYWVLTLLVVPVLTVFGNVLVCLSVYKERSLQTVTNYFIVSLAIADIMVAILAMPLAVYVEVSV